MNKLGMKAKDKITGFEGIIVGKCIYLFGCNQYGVSPQVKDGQTRTTEWFDEGRIDIIGPGVTKEEVSVKDPGGPNRDCPR